MSDDELSLERLLQVVPSLDAAQLLEISAAHQHVSRAVLAEARDAAADVARAEGLLEELQALQGTIIQWAAAQLAPSSRFTGERPMDLPVLADLRQQAQPALLDAATALYLGELLTDDDRDALLGPVDSVIG
jgi:hypothetical protein